ncbi:hypothetical protein V5O48_002443 [Marasmius crinis-equi]|uniref:Zinc finger C3HC4 RING-type domain-containing protein n=1 Tax=Marasmius crinis-equi TaxID=585013 RepID=A0ABR3FVS0_9AGAR
MEDSLLIEELRKEVKRAKSVNVTLTRKWTDAKKACKEIEEGKQESERKRKEDSRLRRVAERRYEELRRELVEAEAKLFAADAEHGDLRLIAQGLQGLSETLQSERDSLANTISTFQERYLEISRIEDIIKCAICDDPMWIAWSIGCGHDFCADCLAGWFHATLSTFKARYPTYDPRLRTLTIPLTPEQRHSLATCQYAHDVLGVLQAVPQPCYSCPMCRVPVTGRPSQRYVLKSIVAEAAAVTGTTVPQQMGLEESESLWDEFWPRDTEYQNLTL